MTKKEEKNIIKELNQLKTNPAIDELDECWDSAIDSAIEIFKDYIKDYEPI